MRVLACAHSPAICSLRRPPPRHAPTPSPHKNPINSYVDVRTQTGFTAIHFAVQSNSRQALAVLLNLGANPLLSSLFDCLDVINCPKGTTALHLAARQGNEAVAKQLLRTYVSGSWAWSLHWLDRHCHACAEGSQPNTRLVN